MSQLLENFLAAVQASGTGHPIGSKETNRYWPFVKNACGCPSVYCFVRKADGAIFPPANYVLPKKGTPWGHIDNYDSALLGKSGLNPPGLRPALRRKLKREEYERQRQEALEVVVAMSEQYGQGAVAHRAVPN